MGQTDSRTDDKLRCVGITSRHQSVVATASICVQVLIFVSLPTTLKITLYAQRTYTVFQKSDAKIQITITTAYLIRIKYPLSGFNYHLSHVNVANFNKIHRTVSEQQLF